MPCPTAKQECRSGHSMLCPYKADAKFEKREAALGIQPPLSKRYRSSEGPTFANHTRRARDERRKVFAVKRSGAVIKRIR
jgi:hypothetical protein